MQCHGERQDDGGALRGRGACDQRSLGGQIDVMFTTVVSAASLVAAGQLRAFRHFGRAFGRVPATADRFRGRITRLRRRVLVRIVRAGQDARSGDCAPHPGGREGGPVRCLQAAVDQELDRYVRQEEERWRKLVKEANIEVQ